MGGGRHVKWKLSNGFTFVMARTPSDHRAALNQLTLLRRLLGVRQQQA